MQEKKEALNDRLENASSPWATAQKALRQRGEWRGCVQEKKRTTRMWLKPTLGLNSATSLFHKRETRMAYRWWTGRSIESVLTRREGLPMGKGSDGRGRTWEALNARITESKRATMIMTADSGEGKSQEKDRKKTGHGKRKT